MERQFKIALVQMQPHNGDTAYNLSRALEYIEKAAAEGATLICLPELFYSGYFLNTYQIHQYAEPQDGPMAQALCAAAKRLSVYLIAGYAEAGEVTGRVYNSAIFINDKGEVIGNTRKCYLWKNEKKSFRSGEGYPLYETPLGKIGILLCYDMEFPEPSRILALKGAELIVCPAAWSKGAVRRWELALSANGLFNLLYVAGVNICDENCCGSSFVTGPDGVTRASLSETDEGILVCAIDLSDVTEQRRKIPYMNDFREDTFSMDAVTRY